jgi:hypothetical protein
MKVEVVSPEEFMGEVIGDLNASAAGGGAVEPKGATNLVTARSRCGRCSATPPTSAPTPRAGPYSPCSFSHYDRVEKKQ